MRLKAFVALVYVALIGVAGAAVIAGNHGSAPATRTETVYIRNEAPRYMSNATIQRDIPAWEKAANEDFAPVWDTPQVSIKLLHGPAPRGAIVATFQKDGSVQGALAYHTLNRGEPAIVVYTGTGDYYGYSNSVSFTHELFETLGDAFVSNANMGTGLVYWVGQKPELFPPGALFVNEVSDPVEAYQYELDGAAISDFVTPNYFGDGASGGLDYMNVLIHQFQIARGGYQIVWVGNQWQEISNFRGYPHRDPRGFLQGEKLGSSVTGGYLFDDEFNGAAGSKPSSTLWNAKTIKGGSGTQFAGWNNISENGQGDLVITAHKVNGVWNSGWLSGKIAYSGPRDVQVRAETACGIGTWSSPVWEWPAPYGAAPGIENDVIEALGRQPDGYNSTLHYWNGGSNPQSGHLNITPARLCGVWHIYEAKVYSDHIDYYFDGTKVSTVTAAAVKLTSLTGFKVVTNISLNMGGWGGTPKITGPVSMLVDYVRVSALP